jgi:hypothetical protein
MARPQSTALLWREVGVRVLLLAPAVLLGAAGRSSTSTEQEMVIVGGWPHGNQPMWVAAGRSRKDLN